MPPARLRKRARLATCLALPSLAAAFHMVQRQPSFTWKPLHAASVVEPPYSSTTRTRPQKKQQPFFHVAKFLEKRMALPSSEIHEEIPTVDSVLRLLPFEGAEVVFAALQLLQLSGVPRDEQRTALALAQRLAEATGDTTVVTAALLARCMATTNASTQQPDIVAPNSRSDSSSSSGADGTSGLSLDAVRDLVGADAANTAAQCAAMLNLHVESRELIWSDPSMQRLTFEQADNMQNMVLSMAADWRVVTLVLAHHASELRAAAEELAAETGSETTEMATSAHWRNWDQEAPPPPSRAAASSSSAETRSTSSTGTSRDGNDLSRRAFVLAREALDVYAPLAHRLGMHQLKVELEDLGFAVLYPQERALVMAAIEERGAKHELVLADTLAVLKRTLQDDTHFMGSVAHVSFAARAKPPYSVWRKLVKLSRDAQLRGETGPEAAAALTARLDQVLDHLALRVVFDVTAPSAPEGSSSTAAAADSDLETSAEKAAQDAKDAKGFALCYHVLGLVHAQWGKNNKDPVSDYKVKDYVSAPKANGYQSLHTTCTCRLHGQAWPFEVQVRTQAMHRVAEWGKAAHVAYKQHDAWTSAYSSQAPDIQGQNPAQDRRSTRSSSGSSRSSGRSSKLGSASHTHKSTKSSKAAPAMGVGRSTKRPWPRSKSHNSPTKSAPPLPDSINDSKSYATWLHGDLRARRVFVFVKGGAQGASILDLEQGCSIVDALRRTNHPSQALRKVRVNGGRVPASYTLRNGDAIVFNGAAASAASTSAASSRKREERMSTL